jgi:hypothetical protein
MALAVVLVLLAWAPALAQTDDDYPEFQWDAEVAEVFQIDCRNGFSDVAYAMCEIDGHGTDYLGTIGVGYEADRLFIRAFIDDSFVATDLDLDLDGTSGGKGRLTTPPEPAARQPVDLPYDGTATCALYDPISSFITHECVLDVPGFEGSRIFVGYHDWQLFASARVPDLGWVAGTVWPDQSYTPAGDYYY